MSTAEDPAAPPKKPQRTFTPPRKAPAPAPQQPAKPPAQQPQKNPEDYDIEDDW
jgi:hypothetical protein